MNRKKHAWKICPPGSYYVRAHYKTVNGKERYWSAHCRSGKTRKDVLNADEIKEISTNFNGHFLKKPKSYNFKVSGGLGNKYDTLIAGWIKYWSDIFNVKSNITADFVKVLMMTESTFGKNALAKTHDRPGFLILAIVSMKRIFVARLHRI